LLLKSKGSTSKGREVTPLPRYGVKGAAIQVVDSFLALFQEAYANSPDSLNDVWAKYTLYASDSEPIFTSAKLNVEGNDQSTFQGDFFNLFPDVFITFSASNQHETDGKLFLDAVYLHDDQDQEDMGDIEVDIRLPPKSSPADCVNAIMERRLEICGILAHEFQHVVQKHAHGVKLEGSASSDVLLHAFDVNEIDARVEEILVLMGDDVSDENETAFIAALQKYVNDYLDRNCLVTITGSSLEECRARMLVEHSTAYKNKMGSSS
jgi:hypothetical protein